MGENGLQSIEYNNLEEVLEPGTDCCIYRVPQHLRQINEKAYTPMLISIGPLQYGKFMGMENQKERFWSKFWEREDIAQISEEFKIYIKDQEQRIRDHYSVSSTLQSPEYVAMIQRDAVFIIELFMRNYWSTDDFLLKPPLGYSIRRDLILLENQVPYFVLNHLYTKAFLSRQGNPSFFALSVFYFCGIIELDWELLVRGPQPQVEHFTDLLRCAIVMEFKLAESNEGESNEGESNEGESNEGEIVDLPTATKLNESGLDFSVIKDEGILDITLVKKKRRNWLPWFEVNTLQIPRIEIYDETECHFRNLMALEMFHYPTQTHICNYTKLMDRLINTVKDVDLLVEKGIIVNCVGDNKVIAKMFNKLGTYRLSSDSCYYDIVKRMKIHYKYPWNHAKATLRSAYFSNVWVGTATVAATFLLILTMIQTVCSIMQL